MKKRVNLDAPSTKRDMEDMGAHIVSAIAKTLEDYATKEDLKKLATKEDIKDLRIDLKATEKKLGDKIDDLGADISEHRRRIRDLETDTVTRREFNEFKTKVLPR